MSARIDVVDESDQGNRAMEMYRDFLRHEIPTNTVRQMVLRVMIAARTEQISRLRIFGHGSPGSQAVGGGQRPDHETQAIRFVERTRTLFPADQLGLLQGHFTPDATVELHGCSVGSGWIGQALVTSLARLWSVRVRAGISTQNADRRLQFEGAFFEADARGQGGIRTRLRGR